jgi:large repetitive protein
MKKTTVTKLWLCLLTVFLVGLNNDFSAQTVRCYTDEQHAARMAANPELESKEQFEQWVNEAIADMDESKIIGGVYQIPVVFHIIHSGEAVGTGSNISQAAVQSQIDVLNEDFRRIFGTNGWNTHPSGADTQIEFCLAQRRPNGTAFTAGQPGVNRILYSTITATAPPYATGFVDGTIKTWTYNGGVATANRGWDPNKYMNIWICQLSGGILGYAQFPESPIGGMGCGATAVATDGVVFTTTSIGKSAVTGFGGVYNEGRTATHEIGHWLGLRHIWGDGGCTIDDYCNDTPEAAAPNYGCPVGTNSCTGAPDAGVDMIENYMDYTNDLCMNIFTNDQKQRMRAVLEGSPLRRSLINSDACTPPNPSDAAVTDVFNPKGDHCQGSIIPSVQLRNRGSNTLTSATISYQIDNGTPTTFAWTGSLTAGSSATVALPAFTAATLGVHTFKAYTTVPNGVADPYAVDDTSSISFVVSNGITPNYTQDFEASTFPPDLRWVVENVNGDCYQWSPASGISSTGVFTNNIAQLPFYGDASTTNENLYTPIFILPCNASAASLQFQVAYRQRVAGSNDRLIVEISQDCGVTWTATTYDKQGSVLATNATLTGANEYYPTIAADWRTETINLLSYVTSTSKNIRFRFRGISNNGNNIFIDNINYTATTPGEINLVQGATDVLDGGSYDFGNVTVGSPQTVTFTVQNTGTTNLTLTPPITLTGAAFALGTTFGVTTVPAGGSTTFTLTFTPSAAGPFTGTVSFATNDCDEGTYNFVLNGTGTTIPPVADFSATPTSACAGTTVVFTNLSTNAASYSWNFGASATPSTSTATNPSVVFNTPGVYPVTLTATNAFGSDVETKTGYIVALNNSGVVLPISEGFVSATFPPSGWSIFNNNSSPTTWIRTTAAGRAPTAGNSMMFDNNNYNDSDDDEVRMTAASFAGLSSAQLTFDVAYAPYNATFFDGLQVLVSTDCGQTYSSVYSKSNTVLATAAATTANFTPTAAQWRTETIDLSAYVGQGSVIVSFKNLSGNGNRLFVDNINLTGVAAATPPTASFTGAPTTVCSGQTVTYTNTSTGSPTSYSWSFPGGTPATSTATNPTVTYNTPGTYNVVLTATNANGSDVETLTNYITVNPLPATPTISAGGPLTFCAGGSVVLTSSSASGNLWSTGATTQSITVSTSGTYTVSVTSGGCTSATSAGTTVTVNPVPSTPTISAGGPLTFCAGGSVVLTSSSASGNLWSTGATTQSITVSTSGTYTVSVTSGGCTSATSAGTTVTVNPVPSTPTISAGGPLTFCAGGSVVLTSSSVSGNLWSTGATTQSITVSTSGTYTVSVTSGGCTSATSAGTTVTVTALPSAPTISAGGPLTFCAGGSVVLTSSSASGNLWSTGATTQSITVSTSGTYTVTRTSGGCTSLPSAGTTVTVNPLPATPTISAGGPLTFCAGGSVVLTSSSASGNLWSTGATTQSITVSTSGTYTVSVTSGGCTSATSAGTTVTVNPLPATPTISAGGPLTFCAGGSVVLTSSSASGNLWSTGATTQSITVSTSGTYTVTRTSGGCTSLPSAGTTVTVNPLPATPTISAGGPLTFCAGGSVVLTSSSATGNLWSTGATTQSITVSTSGTYTVSVTSGGCTSATSAGATVTVNPLPATPTISAGGPLTFCAGGSVVLTSSSASGNLWSTGATTQSITVSTSGTYTVSVTSGGCTSATSAGTTVTVNPLPATPTISAGGPLTFCAGGSVVLTSSSASGNLWSTGATTQSITVSTSGTYTVSVTSGGCTSATSAGTTVTVNPLPATPTISAGGPLTFCAGGSVVLTSSSASGNLWSTGATTQSITVSTSGTYTVSVTSGGCTSAASAGTMVTVNPLPATPTISAGGPLTFCAGGSVVLTSSSASGNLWSTGATTQSITVSTSGTYTVSVTSGGCTSATSAGTTVTVNPLPATPTISAGGPLTFCAGGSVVLTSSSASGNLWSTGATTQSITVSTSGTYTVSVTSGGCTSATSAGTTVTVNPLPATPTISAGGPLTFCAGGSVVLTSSSASGNLWSTGATTQSITVAASGTYTVTEDNGTCVSAASAGTTVTVNPTPTAPTVSASGPLTFCAGDEVTLTSSSASGNIWSTGETTQSITVAASGTYTVTEDNGTCVSAASAGTTVTVNPTPTAPTVSASGPLTFCAGDEVTLTSSSASGNIWSTGETTQSITVSTSGTYTVTEDNGTCVSAASAGTTVTVNSLPTVTFGPLADMCDYNPMLTLTQGSPAGGTYSGTGVTAGQFDPSVPGLGTTTLIYTFIDGNGCMGSATSDILIDDCLSISETEASLIKLYPNPSTGVFTVDAGNTVIEHIVIYDNAGRLVEDLGAMQVSSLLIDLSKHSRGMYTLSIKTTHGTDRLPFVLHK